MDFSLLAAQKMNEVKETCKNSAQLRQTQATFTSVLGAFISNKKGGVMYSVSLGAEAGYPYVFDTNFGKVYGKYRILKGASELFSKYEFYLKQPNANDIDQNKVMVMSLNTNGVCELVLTMPGLEKACDLKDPDFGDWFMSNLMYYVIGTLADENVS